MVLDAKKKLEKQAQPKEPSHGPYMNIVLLNTLVKKVEKPWRMGKRPTIKEGERKGLK